MGQEQSRVWLHRYMVKTNPDAVSCLDRVNNRPDYVKNLDKVYMWSSLRYSVSNTCGGLWHDAGISYVVLGRSGGRAQPRHFSEGLNFCFTDGSGRWIGIDIVPGYSPTFNPFKPQSGR